jgi:hypothetical protein
MLSTEIAAQSAHKMDVIDKHLSSSARALCSFHLAIVIDSPALV